MWYDPNKIMQRGEAPGMTPAEERNRKIISAIIEKAEKTCPGAVALIGVYGSFLTGDMHPRSDLDLLILINDERAWGLAAAFIQDDPDVGHDLYCTSWESLERDAAYEHPHIAKLMDAKIVWCADEQARERLEKLRADTRKRLAAPFTRADWDRAEKPLKEAELALARAVMAENLPDMRRWAGCALYFAENAVAMLNKTYFRLGVKRRYAELDAMNRRPKDLCALIERVVSARTAAQVKDGLVFLLRAVDAAFEEALQGLTEKKKPVSAEAVAGTYEEMYSNWRGKMALAASAGDRHLALMSLCSLDNMLHEIGRETDIGPYDALAFYDPDDLDKTAQGFDALLQSYENEYRKAGLQPRRFQDADAFLRDYLGDGAETAP